MFSKVRRTWSDGIMTNHWGLKIRTSIALRRDRGRTPTDDEIQGRISGGGSPVEVTLVEIMQALDRGDVVSNFLVHVAFFTDVLRPGVDVGRHEMRRLQRSPPAQDGRVV